MLRRDLEEDGGSVGGSNAALSSRMFFPPFASAEQALTHTLRNAFLPMWSLAMAGFFGGPMENVTAALAQALGGCLGLSHVTKGCLRKGGGRLGFR